jgi:hypothetical protein
MHVQLAKFDKKQGYEATSILCTLKFAIENIQVNKTAVFSKQINNFLQVLKKFHLRHKQVRFFSPFWTRRRTFQSTTERYHHMEYERVCPVKFWYYNNLITIDKQTTKTTPNEV